MKEVINKKSYFVGDRVILKKYPNASGTIVKVNYSTITVELSSLSKELDGRMFNITPSDISEFYPKYY